MIPNPWLILGVFVFLIGSHTWAFFEGKSFESNLIKAEQLEATNKSIEQAEVQEVKDNKVVQKEIVIQEKIKIEYRYIREKANENITKNPSYAECGLDDDGLRLFNSSPDAKEKPASEPAS